MAVWIFTDGPSRLLDEFRNAIDRRSIVTWEYDGDGDFTHDTDQWRYSAWMRPRLEETALVMNIIANTTIMMTAKLYAIYHGRLAESFLSHFDTEVSEIVISSLPESEDSI